MNDFKNLLAQAKWYYYKHVVKYDMSYDDFYDYVAFEVISTAMDDNRCIGSRFSRLLGWRFIDYIRKHPKNQTEEFNDEVSNEKYSPVTLETNDNSERDKHNVARIALDEAVENLDKFAALILSGKFKDQALDAKLAKISKIFQINTFLGIPISELPSLNEMCKKKRQNKEYHVNKFDRIMEEKLNNDDLDRYHSVIYTIDPSRSSSQKALVLRNKGEEVKDDAKMFHDLLIGRRKIDSPSYETLSKSGILMLSLVNFLKASFYFKEALIHDPNFIKARYNYAFCLKRLGKLDDTVKELKDCLRGEFEKKVDKGRVLECLGDTYLLKKEYDKALQLFQEALDFIPNDIILLLNCLEAAFHLKNTDKIEFLLNQVALCDEKVPFNQRQFILKIIDTFPDKIGKNCLTILTK